MSEEHTIPMFEAERPTPPGSHALISIGFLDGGRFELAFGRGIGDGLIEDFVRVVIGPDDAEWLRRSLDPVEARAARGPQSSTHRIAAMIKAGSHQEE